MKIPWLNKGKMPFLYRLINCLAWCFLKLFYRIRIYGQEHFCKGAAIVAANHVSFFDPPILGIACPEEVHFLARQSLFKIPILSWLMRKANTHPLKGDGGDTAVFKMVCNMLNQGKKVVLFPEGKRSYDNVLSPIKPGISLFISKTHAAVIPAYIFGTFEAWPRVQAFPKLWKTLGCVFGSPISWDQFNHLDKKEAQEMFAQTLTEAISKLRRWHEQGAHGTPP